MAARIRKGDTVVGDHRREQGQRAARCCGCSRAPTALVVQGVNM